MATKKILFTSKITQNNETETTDENVVGEVEDNLHIVRIHYDEKSGVPVKMLVQKNEVRVFRGDQNKDYSVMHFILKQDGKCKYVVQGRVMEFISKTTNLEIKRENKQIKRLDVEYQLFNGLYLIGYYAIKLIFE